MYFSLSYWNRNSMRAGIFTFLTNVRYPLPHRLAQHLPHSMCSINILNG